MTLQSCYKFAKKNNIEIYRFKVKKKACCTSICNDIDAIGLNYSEITSPMEEKMLLTEELGHCCAGAFYTASGNDRLKKENINKAEYKARKWQIEKLVPIEDLKKAIKGGCKNVYELAEYFEVPEDFISNAFDIYHDDLEKT